MAHARAVRLGPQPGVDDTLRRVGQRVLHAPRISTCACICQALLLVRTLKAMTVPFSNVQSGHEWLHECNGDQPIFQKSVPDEPWHAQSSRVASEDRKPCRVEGEGDVMTAPNRPQQIQSRRNESWHKCPLHACMVS